MFWRLPQHGPSKGVGLVIFDACSAWDESAVIYDIKGENWAKRPPGFRASRGQLCFKFSRRLKINPHPVSILLWPKFASSLSRATFQTLRT